MPVGLRLTYLAAFVIALPVAASAQWLEYPTPGVPRTADGKPDMTAPTPRTADGKPDFSGMWGWETRANCGAHCNDLDLARVHQHRGHPDRAVALPAARGGSGQEASGSAGRRPERSLHAARRSPNLDR